MCVCFFFLFKKNYVFIWLCWVLLAVSGIFHCGTWIAVAQTLRCSKACGILVPWLGIKPRSPALQGRVLITGPPGKSPYIFKVYFRGFYYPKILVLSEELIKYNHIFSSKSTWYFLLKRVWVLVFIKAINFNWYFMGAETFLWHVYLFSSVPRILVLIEWVKSILNNN